MIGDTEDRRRRWAGWRRGGQIALMLTLLAMGAVAGAWWAERRAGRIPAASMNHTGAASPTTAGKSGSAAPVSEKLNPNEKSEDPVEVSLTPEAVKRAGIQIVRVAEDVAMGATTVPGTVTSNAYRDTKINSLVGGIVREVKAELGVSVRRGEPLAVVFSSELADAQMKYLSMQAMFIADHQKLSRTQKLTEIGVASRQELEEVTAIHETHATEFAAARQRLLLLGLTKVQVERLTDASHIVSELAISAPLDGFVIGRTANPGQVITAGQELFIVTDLSTVWVIGDLYERDFSAVRVGSPASVTLPSLPEARPLRGRVAYIDPRVDSATRTAKVRVEVPNASGALKLGMFVQVAFETRGTERRAVVPRAAVQTVGSRNVVYVSAEEDGRFIEKVVKLGPAVGDVVQVLEGLKPGERVVTVGSFLLRAEAARVRPSS